MPVVWKGEVGDFDVTVIQDDRPKLLVQYGTGRKPRRDRVTPAEVVSSVTSVTSVNTVPADLVDAIAKVQPAAAEAAGSVSTEGTSAGLFAPVDMMMAEVKTLPDRDRRAPDRLEGTERNFKPHANRLRWRRTRPD